MKYVCSAYFFLKLEVAKLMAKTVGQPLSEVFDNFTTYYKSQNAVFIPLNMISVKENIMVILCLSICRSLT